MTTTGERFVQECVIGFGFLNGIFFAVGVDPEGMLIQSLINLLSKLNPDSVGLLAAVFAIVSVLFLVMMIWGAYNTGGVLGLFAVLLAFFGGVILLTFAAVGMVLLIVAVILGFIAPEFRYHPL